MNAAFSVELGEGRRFHAQQRITGDLPILGDIFDDEQGEGRKKLVQYVLDRFVEAVRAKAPENERLRRNEWYYNGRHWNDAETNRQNEVRNFCFATVETVHPILTEVRPRPEVVLRKMYDVQLKADALNDRANWVMDVSGFDYNCALGDREKLKHGYSVYLLNVDDRGVCVNYPYSVYDFYRDPCASNDDEMEYYFLARPQATDFLASEYGPDTHPHLWERLPDGSFGAFLLEPDNIMSPSYRAIQWPFETDAFAVGAGFEPENIFGTIARLESEAQPAGVVSLVRTGDQERRIYGRTNFVIQMVVRDRTVVQAHYTGQISEPDVANPGMFKYADSPSPWRRYEPTCPSGWRIITISADGTFIDSEPLDPCYLGRNVVIDRDYPQVGRWESPGELDHIIPINRSINSRLTGIRNAHAFENDPVLVLDQGAGNDIQNRSVTSGDVIRKQPGTQATFLNPPSISPTQESLVTIDLMHMDQVSGVHDVTEGRRPEGIEAGVAIQNLQQAAQTRIRGKQLPAFQAKSIMLKKMMYATGKKMDPGMAMLVGGQQVAIDPKLMTLEYDIRFAEQSGTAVGRAQMQQQTVALKSAGLMDTQSALQRMGVPGWPEILSRLALESRAQAAAASAEGGKNPQEEK